MAENIIIPPPDKSLLNKGLDVAIKGGIIIGGVFFLRKPYREWQKNSEEKLAGKSPETRQAMSLRSAMNPSGISWMKSFDTTNLTQIFTTAGEISDIEKVRQSYKNLYNDDLWDDLRSELSPSEFERFSKTVQFKQAKKEGKSLSVSQSKELKKGWVISEKTVTMRRSPHIMGIAQPFSTVDLIPFVAAYDLVKWLGDKYKGTNIIASVPANKELGYYSANNNDQEYDSENNIHFIRVISVTPENKTVIFWVARSNVKTVQTSGEAASYKKFYVESKAFAGLNGVSNLVIATNKTRVLNENMAVVGIAMPEMIIGVPLGEKLSGSNGTFIKLRTQQGKDRWVNEKLIKII